jgi:hypothetical protein
MWFRTMLRTHVVRGIVKISLPWADSVPVLCHSSSEVEASAARPSPAALSKIAVSPQSFALRFLIVRREIEAVRGHG